MTDNKQTEQSAFEEALQFLSERTMFGINLGLERIIKLLEQLGNPHQKNVRYIHVGGTNGKGSTAAYLAAMLQAAGYRVGVFTSPHLHCYTERMVINGKQISPQDVVSLINRIKPILARMDACGLEPPTEFEVNTAMALLYFTEQNVDFAIMEVGMGGEIDSTNVIWPDLAIITNVAMDHMAYLGDTVAEIAKVKAGIIKQGIPVITGAKAPEALQEITKKCKETGSRLMALGETFHWQNRQTAHGKQTFCYQQGNREIVMETTMQGQHQLDNCALAVTAALQLGIDEKAIQQGAAAMVWPGRLEVVSQQPFIIIDGAHNQHGMAALKQVVLENWQDDKVIAVLGMLADKEREKALAELLPYLDYAVITKVPNKRAGDWQHLGAICHDYGVAYEAVEDVAKACEKGVQVLQDCNAEKKMLLVTGSLYMIAAARAYFLQR